MEKFWKREGMVHMKELVPKNRIHSALYVLKTHSMPCTMIAIRDTDTENPIPMQVVYCVVERTYR